ncbi:cytochrome B [Rhodoferax koreense]|uniref:Cytochrome B n=1 Tax=Rhodoferax koreensis TaxID=1842727 RepID=A0A1P8JVI8_9BURK|nr:cytochrome b [Rhodoferax koreense]APW37789.1 cytochrome B [Rhodoferax koreense]
MSTSDFIPGTSRYSTFLRYAHWVTVVLVFLAYISINARKFLERGSAERLLAVESHYLIGIVVLLITVPRILVRLRQEAPPILPALGPASRLASKTAHLALFMFLIVQPVLGVASRLVSGRGIGMPLTEWSIPSFAVAQPELAKSLIHLHEFIGDAFYYVIGMHILAALWHLLVRRDNVLQRMV